MSISELGSLGEFISSIAVLVTLIYLALQIRQNTKATRASVRQGVTNQSSEYISMGLDNRVVAAARTKQRLNEPLDPYEDAYAQYRNGLFSEPEWRAFQDVMFSLFRGNKYAREMRKRTGQANRAFAPDFIEVVENIRLRAERSQDDEPKAR